MNALVDENTLLIACMHSYEHQKTLKIYVKDATAMLMSLEQRMQIVQLVASQHSQRPAEHRLVDLPLADHTYTFVGFPYVCRT
jgi:hypothetical protein